MHGILQPLHELLQVRDPSLERTQLILSNTARGGPRGFIRLSGSATNLGSSRNSADRRACPDGAETAASQGFPSRAQDFGLIRQTREREHERGAAAPISSTTDITVVTGERYRVQGDVKGVERVILDAARGSIMQLAWLVEAETGEALAVNPKRVVTLRAAGS